MKGRSLHEGSLDPEGACLTHARVACAGVNAWVRGTGRVCTLGLRLAVGLRSLSPSLPPSPFLSPSLHLSLSRLGALSIDLSLSPSP
eukprot:1098309-Rhodomonas_salina.4